MSRAKERTRSNHDNDIDGIVTIDEAGLIQTANLGVERIFGYSPAELVDRDVSMLLPEPDRSAHDESLSRGPRTGGARIIGLGREVDGRRRDGTLFPMDLAIGEFRIGDRRLSTVVIRDITERKRAAEADARLAAIVRSSDDAIFATDLDGLITSWNGGAERILGYRAEEVLGRPVGLLFPPDREHEGPEILRRIERGERVEPHESVQIAKDGRRIDLSLSVSPIRDATGRLVGTARIARDLGDRGRPAQAPEPLACPLDRASDPILVWERGGRILSWNRGASQLYGFTAAEALGRVRHELLHTEFPHGREDCEAALRRHGRWEGRLRHRTRDGRWVAVESRMSTVRMADRHEHVLEVDRDAATRRPAKEAIRHRLELPPRPALFAAPVPGFFGPSRMPPDVGAPSPFAMPGVEDLYGPPPSMLADDISAVRANGHSGDARPLIEGIDEAFRRTVPRRSRSRYLLRPYAPPPLLDNIALAGPPRLGSDRPAVFSPEQIEVAREVADHLAIALRQPQFFEEVEATRIRLADLSRRLIRAQEDERHHIARELHDEIGQSLTAIKIHLQVIGRDGLDPAQMRSRLNESIALVERTLGQIRGISLDLRPSLLDDFGLVAALRSHIDHQARIAGFAARFDVAPAGVDFRLEPELETACFRVAQEALTNIARHAGARNVGVELRRTDSELDLVVRDDGAGFDVAEARSRGAAGASLGLAGMRERVGILGGRIAIRSAPGRGTEVSARFPLIVRPFGE